MLWEAFFHGNSHSNEAVSAVFSGSGGLIMPDSDAPEDVTGNQEEKTRKGEESIPSLSTAEEKQKRIVLDTGIGDEEGDDQQKAFSVDVKGIFSVFSRTVCKNVHELQTFQSKKTDGGIDQEQTGKQGRSSGDHENHGEAPGRRPEDAARLKSIDEHDDGLQEPGGAGEFDFLSEYLKDQAAGTDHDPVKGAVPDDGAEGIEASGEGFRQREGHEHDAVAQKHLLIGIALYGVESSEHEINAEEHIEGGKELSQAGEKKRGFILHDAFYMNQEIAPIETDGI